MQVSDLQVSHSNASHSNVTSPEVRVNGQPEPLSYETVALLLARHAIDAGTKGVAVALNGAVLPRARWGDTLLSAGDRIEIVHAKQGG